MTADPRAGRAEFRPIDLAARPAYDDDPAFGDWSRLEHVRAVLGRTQPRYWITPFRYKVLAGMPPPPPLEIPKAPAHVGRFALRALVIIRREHNELCVKIQALRAAAKALDED